MPTLRVALADDHPVVREGLKTILRTQDDLEVVGEAVGSQAVGLVAAVGPDVLVLGVSPPGTAAVERVRQAHPACKILALSAHPDRGHAQAVLAAGATGYALQRSAAVDLIRGLRAVAAGQAYLDPALGDRDDGPADAAGELSQRETEVLRLIAQGFSNKEIAARLVLSVKTVETYKARSQEKLGLRTRVDLVRYAARHGWLNDL